MAYKFRETGDQPGSRPTYKDILRTDAVPAPEFLVADTVPDLGTDPVPATNYTCPDFYRREVEKMWLRCWQMACREEEIPNVGDYVVYDNVGKTLLIVRTAPDTIKALYNVCLHRGRKLETRDGCRKAFRCRFHGWEWNVDGSFRHNPWSWDFPQLTPEQLALPEAKVGRWGGFVFVNFDPDAPALEKVLWPIPDHFKGYDLENTWTCVHVAKKYPANWKVTAEAFMESHHSIATHPQFMPYLGDVNSGYDVFSDFTSRQMTAMGVPSPFIDPSGLSQTEILDAMLDTSGRLPGQEHVKVPPGMSARAFAAQQKREAMAAEDGYDYSQVSDAEMLDPMLYNVFPNMSFWGGFAANLVYRWRPVDVDNTIMDIYLLKRVPKSGARPRPVPTHWLTDDEPFASAPELGALGGVFDQDMANLPYVQEGLKAMGTDIPVQFAKYTEIRLRHLHRTLRKFTDG